MESGGISASEMADLMIALGFVFLSEWVEDGALLVVCGLIPAFAVSSCVSPLRKEMAEFLSASIVSKQGAAVMNPPKVGLRKCHLVTQRKCHLVMQSCE